jgi:hypothetical protein
VSVSPRLVGKVFDVLVKRNEGGRSDPADSTGCSEGGWTSLDELLTLFRRETGEVVIGEVDGEGDLKVSLVGFDVAFLLFEV